VSVERSHLTSPRLVSRRAVLGGAGALALGVPSRVGRDAAGQQAASAPPTLTGIVWEWQATVAPDGAILRQPDEPGRYTLTFGTDGTLAIQADCNRGRGVYAIDGTGITIQIGGVTRMRCPAGSLMQMFLGDLEYVVTLDLAPDALALVLTAGSAMQFAPAPSAPATPTVG
jgi:heat shock protein HslJ